MKRTSIAIILLLAPVTVFADADSDFVARCGAPGVVLCAGFDSANEVNDGIQFAGDGTQQGFIDMTEKLSGAGSLKFTFRPGVSYANIGGAWSSDLSHSFVSGQTIYVQYRWKAPPSYFTNNDAYWNSSVKQLNIHGASSTCQGSEFTTITGGRLEMYTNCGDGFHTDVATNALVSSCPGDCLIQQGSNLVPSPNGDGYNCHYQDQFAGIGDGSGCFWPVASTWYTIYEKISLGTWGGSDTAIEAWESHDGSPYRQFHRVNGVTWNDNGDAFLNRIRLETYMTEISGAAPVPAYIWYDELIVSTQPIAVPTEGTDTTPPSAPTGLGV